MNEGSPVSQKKYHLLQPLAAAVGISFTLGAIAQESENTGALEEVVVTARKQAENLQKVPVAVTALSESQMQELGITRLDQVAKQTPNVTLEASRATNSTLTAYIRGVGQQDPLWGFEPGVGVYIDDIYFARPQAALLDVYDVARIEVLRGPQGTLYGKNTIGGAIKYVTKSVRDSSPLSVKATVGSYNQRDLKVSSSAEVVEDRLWIGGAVASLNRDGFGEYVGPINEGEENYNKDSLAYRLSAEAQLSDNFSARLDLDKTNDDSNNRGGHRLTDEFVTGAAPLDNVFDTRSAIDPTQEVVNEGASLTMSWDLSDSMVLKSITAQREGSTFTSIDFDNQQLGLVEAPATRYTDEQFSQELQLTYSGDRFNGVAGIYYFDGDATGAFDLEVFKGLFADAAGNPLIGTRTIGAVNTKSTALYAQGTYAINDDWSATVGGRYTKDEKSTESFFSSYNATAGIGDFNNQIVASDFTRSPEWSEFSPRVGLEYDVNEDVMVFASFAEGFKSGGVDPRANLLGNPNSGDPFDPETVGTMELGMKSQLLDGRMRLNVTLFNNDYDDQQVTTSILIDSDGDGNAESFAGQVVNAGKASARGLEIESIAALTDNLRVNFTYGYIDAEIEEFITVDPGTLQPVNIADQRVVSNTPENTVNLGISYDMEMFGGQLMLNSNASYRSEIFLFETESPIDQEGYTVVDANAVWLSPSEQWTFGLHGKNLADEEYRVAGYNFPTLANSVIGYYGDPRMIMASLSYQF
ncbi:TonB-dependent receptor [Microbulbifer flavimaris]|uniref:TonB-dependent receptor n=1 Tax=Microbulbifer flavimaris TaxID=1781068 RepID=A0ABX4I5J3_9GAMM|nr:TonB-dependent receptor [Microbulbifer flavimaris]